MIIRTIAAWALTYSYVFVLPVDHVLHVTLVHNQHKRAVGTSIYITDSAVSSTMSVNRSEID